MAQVAQTANELKLFSQTTLRCAQGVDRAHSIIERFEALQLFIARGERAPRHRHQIGRRCTFKDFTSVRKKLYIELRLNSTTMPSRLASVSVVTNIMVRP